MPIEKRYYCSSKRNFLILSKSDCSILFQFIDEKTHEAVYCELGIDELIDLNKEIYFVIKNYQKNEQ
jgi:hypothetical protein